MIEPDPTPDVVVDTSDDYFGPCAGPSLLAVHYLWWWRREQLLKFAREQVYRMAMEFMEEAKKTHRTLDSTESPA